MLGGALALLVSYSAAHAVMGVVAWWLLASAQPMQAPAEDSSTAWSIDEPGPQPIASPTRERMRAERIQGRMGTYNPFCPECTATPASEAMAPTNPPPPGVRLLEPGEQETGLPLTLIATMEAMPPGRSFATIAHEGKVGLFGEGDLVLDGVSLLEVDAGAVHLEVQDAVELLRLRSDDRAKQRTRAQPIQPASPPKSRPKSGDELDGAREAIHCRGSDCTIDRRFVEQLLTNPALLARQGRAAPYAREGLQGFRLSRVRAGTIPRLLGLRSGDVVTSINGQPLANLDAAMRLLTRLRHASHLSIELVRNRRGQRQPMRLDIDIV